MKVRYSFKLVVDIDKSKWNNFNEDGENTLLKKTVEELIQLGYIETST